MKPTKNIPVKQIRRCIPFALIFFTLQFSLSACKTMIPRRDSTPPEIIFKLSGPGLGQREWKNPPQDSWERNYPLKRNSVYDFTLIVKDDGGMLETWIEMPEYLEILRVDQTDHTYIEESSYNNRVMKRIRTNGLRSDPRDALILSGRIKTPNVETYTTAIFNIKGMDFGGISREPNTTKMDVYCVIYYPFPEH